MTNYEKYKDDIEKLGDKRAAFDKFKNKIVKCVGLACEDCAFYANRDDCTLNAMRWAAEEYKEPEIDWSKVPVDTPVLVSNNKEFWFNRYFAGVDDDGRLFIFQNGRTSWSNKGCDRMVMPYKYIKLAEVSEYERIT